jgi:hypothetical protein
MCWEDFQSYFSHVGINYSCDGSYFCGVEVTQADNGFALALVTVPEEGTGHAFSLSQQGQRMFARGADYSYSGSHIILMRLNNGTNFDDGVTYVRGEKGLNRDTNIVIDEPLEAGTYAIFGEVEWNESAARSENTYAVSRYGPGHLEVHDITDQYDKHTVLMAAFKSACEQGLGEVKQKTKEAEGAAGITVFEGDDPSYYFYQYVVNREAAASYKYVGEYTDAVGLTIQEPHGDENSTKYELACAAGDEAMFIMKKSIKKFSYGKSYFEKIELGSGALV